MNDLMAERTVMHTLAVVFQNVRRATGVWLVRRHVLSVKTVGSVTNTMEAVCVSQDSREPSVTLVKSSTAFIYPALRLIISGTFI